MSYFQIKDAAAIVESLAKQLSAQTTITKVDSTNFVDAGKSVLATGTENVMNALSQLVGRTITAVRASEDDEFSLIDKSEDSFSDRIRKISIYSKNPQESGFYNTDENTNSRECFINDIKDNEMGLDIGTASIKLFKQHIMDSKTVIWNGPVGMFELDKYANGTIKLCEALVESGCVSIIGGGDTASAAINFGFKEKFTHISTGGGASLELLEGKQLPGIEVIK